MPETLVFQVTATGAGGVTGPPAYVTVTVNTGTIPTSTLNPASNLLTDAQWGADAATTGWAAGVNASLVRSTTGAITNAGSLELTHNGSTSGFCDFKSTTLPTVVARATYVVGFKVKARSGGGTLYALVNWYAGSTLLSQSTLTPGPVAVTTTTSTVTTAGVIAPVSATKAELIIRVDVNALGSAYVFDEITFTQTAAPVTDPVVTPGSGTRDINQWPFSGTSPWNRPLTTSAVYEAKDVGATNAVVSQGTRINGNNGYSHSAWIAVGTDPLATWTDTSTQPGSIGVESYVPSEVGQPSIQQRIPIAAQPASGTDGHLHALHNGSVVETWVASKPSNTQVNALRVVRNDLYGSGIMCSGTRAYDGSAIGGLIRLWELTAGYIRHAVAIAMGNQGQLQTGPVWPAATDDYEYAVPGPVRMGMMFAIPASVNLSTFSFIENGVSRNLNREGLILGLALQRFGAFVVDMGAPTTFYLEEKIGSDTEVNTWQWKLQRGDGGSGSDYAQLIALKNELRQVTNSHDGNTAYTRNKSQGTAWLGTALTDQAPVIA